jgi:carboxyl-terminal processing protease
VLKRPAARYFVLALVGLVLVGGASATDSSRNVYNNIKTYNRILASVYDKYVDDVDSKDLIYASIRGMMDSLDPHSAFLEKKQYDDLMMETQGKYGGVGISIDIRDDWLTVVSPIEGGPAYALGIQAGDRIIAIEGESTKGISTSDAAKLLRGKKGTQVTITIARKGEPAPFDVEITRDVVELKSVPYVGVIRDDIGYLRLSRFSEDSGREVEEGLEKLVDMNVKGVVFDLRNNHGGLLTQAVAVADKFLERGKLISYTQGRHASDRSEYHASERPVLPTDIPLVVLVNSSTASAAEIVSGALQDDGRAVILGELTYGKGLVQTLIPLDPEANLKLTTAKWYTPAGRCIQKPFDEEKEDAEIAAAAGEEMPSIEVDEKAEIEAEPPVGGILPDVELEGDRLTRYGIELLSANHFFRFGVNYASEHEIPRDWRVTDDVVEQFRQYLVDQEFDYQTVAQLELERLGDIAEEMEFAPATRAAMDQLEVELEGEKSKDFEKNRDYVQFELEREIMSKVWGTEGRYEVTLRDDNQAQAAVDILTDSARYGDILLGKEAIAAVDRAAGGESGERMAESNPYREEN